jgi:hypothetical protein
MRAPTGRVRCPTPVVRADLVETQAWDALVEALSDEARLRAELEAARDRRRRDDQGRDDRRRAIEGEIASCERRLRVHVKRITELEAEGDEMAKEELAVHITERDDAKALLVRLRRELKDVETLPGAGLSALEVDELQRLAADVRLVGREATVVDRRRIIGLINLCATVGSGGEQVQIQSRPVRAVAMRWHGAIALGDNDSGSYFLKYDLQTLCGLLAFAA